MKNKEIEELLKNFQEVLDNPTTTDECYDGRIIEIDRSYDLEQDEIKLLLSYIEQLEKELQNYKDLDISNMETIDCQELEIVNRENKITQLENNRDKAIEYIETHTENIDRGTYYEDYVETYDLLNILKGDSK